MELGEYEISTPERQYDEACGAVHPKLFGPYFLTTWSYPS